LSVALSRGRGKLYPNVSKSDDLVQEHFYAKSRQNLSRWALGKKGREIVQVDVKSLVDDLKKAYADEWIAFYYYTWIAQNASGIYSDIIADVAGKIAGEEKEHADELADRISELGDVPTKNFEEIQRVANCRTVDFPEDLSDWRGQLKALTDAEACAIGVYNGMIQKLAHCYKTDIKTFHLIEHILSEEIAHEEKFENLM
jgi:bacterioferritin